MRTRDWRRAQIDKRRNVAIRLAVRDFERRHPWRKTWKDTLRSFLKNEGRNWYVWGHFGPYECGACWYPLGSCQCKDPNTRRGLEAADYDLRGVKWEYDPPLNEASPWEHHDADRLEWAYFCDYHYEWGYYDFNAPLLKRVADFVYPEAILGGSALSLLRPFSNRNCDSLFVGPG